MGYIVPIDAPRPVIDETGFMRRAIDMRQIETVAKRIRAKHVLMVFDSCFSGALFSMVRAAPSHYIEEKIAAPVREFITAGREEELASLIKKAKIKGVHMDPVFDSRQIRCWTADPRDPTDWIWYLAYWIVDFKHGTLLEAIWEKPGKPSTSTSFTRNHINYVKAVRSVE